MRRDSQQSIERSPATRTRRFVQGTVLSLAALGAVALGQVEVKPSTSNKSEVAFMDPSFAANFLRYNPKNAFADALWECWTTFTAKVHAPKENPDQDIRGVVLTVYNKTNPTDVKRLVAVEQSSYRDDKQYQVNTVVEGSTDRVANVYGNPTKENHCSQEVIKCDETTLVIQEVGGRGEASEVQSECPHNGQHQGQPCDKWIAWAVEQGPKPTPTIVPDVTPTTKAECPEGTKMIGDNPLICEKIVIVPDNPPMQQ